MTQDELHAFGIDLIIPYIQNEGVNIESVNLDPKINPQIVGRRWNSLAHIVVRTSCFPKKGELTSDEFEHILDWADKKGAIAFFASVGIACVAYPDKSPVSNESEMGLPVRNAGFNVAYEGLLMLTRSNRVQVWGDK